MSPSTAAGTVAEPATPNPTDTPPPRSIRATVDPSLVGSNDAAEYVFAPANQPCAATGFNEVSTGCKIPDASGANAAPENNRWVRDPSAFAKSAVNAVRFDTSSTAPAFTKALGSAWPASAADATGGIAGPPSPAVRGWYGIVNGKVGPSGFAAAGAPGPATPCVACVVVDGGANADPDA